MSRGPSGPDRPTARQARMPGRNLGTRMLTLVPAPGAFPPPIRSRCRMRPRSRSSTFARPTCAASDALGPPVPTRPRRVPRPEQFRVHAHSVVLDADDAVRPGVGRHDRDGAPGRLAGQPVPHRVLHQRLQREEGQHDASSTSLRHRAAPASCPRSGPARASDSGRCCATFRQHGVLAGRPERVAGEVGELEDQFPRPFRVGAHERRDRAERVVDEVRLICARNARTSARSSRARDESSSAS